MADWVVAEETVWLEPWKYLLSDCSQEEFDDSWFREMFREESLKKMMFEI